MSFITIDEAIKLLLNKKAIVFPTETVYGLAGNALKPETIRKIFETKNRPTNNPLILHAAHIEQIKSYVIEWPAWADTLAAKFWPGPLTLLLKGRLPTQEFSFL